MFDIMSKFCTSCGFSLDDDIGFCPSCGTAVSHLSEGVYKNPISTDIGITAENLFLSASQEISDLFSYDKAGRGFTGDLSHIRNRIRRSISSAPSEVLDDIADSHMADIRICFSRIDENLNDENWTAVFEFLKNSLPRAIVAFFYNPGLGPEVKNITVRLKRISEKKWDKTNFIGKIAVPAAKFENVYTLRYVMNNLKF